MCNKQCGAMTHQETTDRINALGYALGALNDSIGTLPYNEDHASAIDNARFSISNELVLLTTTMPSVVGQAKAEKKTIGEHVRQARTTQD